MQRRVKFILGMVFTIVIAGSLLAVFYSFQAAQPMVILSGSLYFNDSGESHGGFEAAMQWNVTLIAQAGNGWLIVTPEQGYMNNDVLKKWSYRIIGFQITDDMITMALDGHLIVLEFYETDATWDTYHNHYICTTPDLNPTIFLGFLGHYYVELRLASRHI